MLDIQWLEGLGKLVTDYSKGTMQFKWGDITVTLTLRVEEHAQEVGVKGLEKLLKKGDCYAIWIKPASNSTEIDPIKLHIDILIFYITIQLFWMSRRDFL